MALKGNTYTLSELRTKLSIDINDASFTRWSSSIMDTAIRRAMDSARNRWWEDRTDETQTYSSDTFSYTLPPACERVLEVRLAAILTGDPDYLVRPQFWKIVDNSLVLYESWSKYDGQTLKIYYSVHPSNLLDVSGSDGVVSGTTLTSATDTFITDGVRVGDSVRLYKSSYAGNGTYYVAEVTSETVLTLNDSPGTGSGISYYVAQYTDMPEAFLLAAAKAWLFEWASMNKVGREVQTTLQQAAYFKQVAEMELNNMLRPGDS